MLHLIPQVKKLEIKDGFLHTKAVRFEAAKWDSRVVALAMKLPYDPAGAALHITCGAGGEGYQLDVTQASIQITADGPAGAFYALQTLRQLFAQDAVPCLHIEDHPDFAYRGFYHDVSRGKIPNMETLKQLIDRMAYYKLNSLQLYVEHTFEFKECEDIISTRGYLSKAEIQELDAYCRENFIEFIPSMSTFGHMYEVLQQPKYRHLRAATGDDVAPALWHSRMKHHTIDPRHPESFPLVQSMIDQYASCFESEWFNICGDETFDLHNCAESKEQTAELYVEFVKKIISHVQGKGKKVMMWADFFWMWNYPEAINMMPDNICYLNWWYYADPQEENVAYLAEKQKLQILCPGTSSWFRLCENVGLEEINICQMAEFGKKYNAMGILNTNWGDLGNPCSLDLAMYGLVLGAEKSWSVATAVDEDFYNRVNTLLYEEENGFQALQQLSKLHDMVSWTNLDRAYSKHRYNVVTPDHEDKVIDLPKIQKAYLEFAEEFSSQSWKNDEFRQEMLIAAEGACVIAEMQEKLEGKKPERITNTDAWLGKFREKWLQKNKKNELHLIEELFRYCDSI